MLRIRVKGGYDLRISVAEKAVDADDFDGWTAFVNKRQTLFHMLKKNRMYLVRDVLPPEVKNWSRRKIAKHLASYFEEDFK